jgi:adenosylcobinamide-GDP ribazoletransferase
VGIAVAVGSAIAVALVGPWAVPAVSCAAAGAAIVGILSWRKIGGLTGDVLGSAQQAAEIFMLVGAVAAVTNGWMVTPWWR